MTQWILSGAAMARVPQAPRRRLRWLRVMPLLHLWAARWRERCALADLDAHLLRDIGVSRDEARCEARKPFWRP